MRIKNIRRIWTFHRKYSPDRGGVGSFGLKELWGKKRALALPARSA
jgi:hypothetical protein